MSHWLHRAALATALAASLAGAAPAHAQPSGWRSFASITPVYEGEADLDSGGDFSAGQLIVRAGAARDWGGGVQAGATLSYDYTDYSFSNPVAFGAIAPWNIVQHYGVSFPMSFAVRDGWSVGIVPSVDWFRENGASTSDALAWGAIFSATRQFEGGNRLGIGIAVFDKIEETSVFPVILVDWRLTYRWRLVNPLPSGPTGPAGLELDYRFDSGWNLGLGAAVRSVRFRLSESGPVPNGVGEERGVPVFLRATRSLGESVALNLYAGVVAWGRLRVEDPSGNLLREDDFDPAPLFGVTISGNF
jgi:hypothetical protein